METLQYYILSYYDIIVVGLIWGSLKGFWAFFLENPATVSLVFLSAALIHLTAALTRELRAMRRLRTEPQLVVSVEPSQAQADCLDLVIENIGQGIALDIIVIPENEVTLNHREMRLAEKAFLKHSLLKPGKSIPCLLGRYKEIKPREIGFKVSYKDKNAKSYQGRFVTNIDLYGEVTSAQADMHEIALSARSLAESIRYVTTGFRRFNVDVFGAEERIQKVSANTVLEVPVGQEKRPIKKQEAGNKKKKVA